MLFTEHADIMNDSRLNSLSNSICIHKYGNNIYLTNFAPRQYIFWSFNKDSGIAILKNAVEI